MKIIFLDIDQVLNSVRSSIALKGFGSIFYANEHEYNEETLKLDPIAVLLLRKVVEETDAKIVISSTWRLLANSIEDFFKVFDVYGWDTRNIIIGMTPQIGKIRGYDVKDWLESNQHVGITNYIIIDDNSDFLPEQKPYFVQTNPYIGFSHVTYNECIEKLGVKNAQ